ncbi:hypothetical protein EI94DRAFT_1812249 [Lactarius quietus]|nr:hypothetical protein EI94DRAFT_1812249 [Lactarius quietus]
MPIPQRHWFAVKENDFSRKLRKERSMRVPAIENDMMNRIGIPRKLKVNARAASPKASGSSTRTSPYKTMLVGIARTKVGSRATSDAEGSGGVCLGNTTISVRCASPEPQSPSPSRPQSPSPLTPKQPATATSTAETKGKKKPLTPQSSVVLRPLPSRVAASSSRIAASPSLSRKPLDASTTPEAPRRSSRTSPSTRAESSSSRKQSSVARQGDASPKGKPPTASASKAGKSAVQPTKAQGKKVSPVQSASCPNFGAESDSQSDDHSNSDTTSEVGSRSVPDVSAAGVAQATAIKQSLLSQIEERNEGKKWDDLLGFFHGLAPGEVRGLLKTATRAGRRALHRLAGKEAVESGISSRVNDVCSTNPGSGRRPQRRGESVLRFDDAASDGEREVINQTTVPPRQSSSSIRPKARQARSPTPPFHPPPVVASASSSRTTDDLSAPASRKRCGRPRARPTTMTTTIPPSPRRSDRRCKNPDPSHAKAHSTITPHPRFPRTTTQRRGVGAADSTREPLQELPGPLDRAGDPFAASDDDDDDDDEWAESRIWTLDAARRGAGAGADGGVESDDAMRRPALGSTNLWS